MNAFRIFFALLFFWCAPLAPLAHAEGETPTAPPIPSPPPVPSESDATRLVAALRREEELKAELAKFKNPPKDDEDDLIKKARLLKGTGEDHAKQTRLIETALGFNMGVDEFVKVNANFLPNEIAEIVKLAHKETYDSAQAKASALKASMIQSYFAVQANLDALTNHQKNTLTDYLKLTKTGKEERAAEVYENIFEPALEMVRKVKKAEELSRSRSGYGSDNASNSAYKNKLISLSRKTHLGEAVKA